jgi:hypothetical protein
MSARQFFGRLLVTVGFLIAGLAGLCTGAVVIYGVVTELAPGGEAIVEMLSMLPIPVLVGGIPIAIGVVLILAGRSILRSKGDRRSP